METNGYQIGGSHYNKMGAYQHWDLVIDTSMNYLLGCATKYIARWKDKNGVEDLRKAIHYIGKFLETYECIPTLRQLVFFGIKSWFCGGKQKYDPLIVGVGNCHHVDEFCGKLGDKEADVIKSICSGNFEEVLEELDIMISDVVFPKDSAGEATQNYVDQ